MQANEIVPNKNSPDREVALERIPFFNPVIIEYSLEPGKTAYNPTPPFVYDDEGSEGMIVRYESFESETDSKARVFRNSGNHLEPDDKAPCFQLQDPFYCGQFIDGDKQWTVIGGVRITTNEANDIINWQTAFYRYEHSIYKLGPSEQEPKPFALSDDGHKDIRLTQLANGRIAVFTRPQGDYGGKGKIGYLEINSLDELEAALHQFKSEATQSKLIDGLFKDHEWGGANQAYAREDGLIEVLGHVAQEVKADDSQEQECRKRYEAIFFLFDPSTFQVIGNVVRLAERNDFPTSAAHPPKRPSLTDVVFPGGLERLSDSEWRLTVGLGDSSIGQISFNPCELFDRINK